MFDLVNMSYAELETFVTEDLGESRFRARQIWEWIWKNNCQSIDEMSNLSKKVRQNLEVCAYISRPQIETSQQSADGTIKFLLRLADGALVETVLIPSRSREDSVRMTQCLSCQVGCAMGCTFCSTGSMGFIRNMSMAEILGQVLVARDYLHDTDPSHPKLRNLVFMGMGEPLLNFNECMRSLTVLNDTRGVCFSPRRITVSTCGIREGLEELGASGLAYLAVSLHAPTQELRAQIMPKAARWPLDALIESLVKYPLKTRERMTLEYILLGGVNDQPEHARQLARLLGRLKAKLNLIVYNPSEGMPYQAPKADDILAFEKYLWSKGITAVVRKSKGQDIQAACGQLAATNI